MHMGKTVYSTQEQAAAAWIQYLYRVRIDRLQELLQIQGNNLETALATLDQTLETIKEEIINNGLGRGGTTGMHGFIAEVAECGVANARHQLEHGGVGPNVWIDDNGPADIERMGVLIQQKFSEAGGHLSLNAIKSHLKIYPDFLKNGGKYQIPKDHYEKIVGLLKISKEQADKLPTGTGDFSKKQWEFVQAYFKENNITLDDIEPSQLTYPSVQRDAIDSTIAHEKADLHAKSEQKTEQITADNQPTLQEGMKTAAVAAALEAGAALVIAINRKRKGGKKLAEFSPEDWEDIAKESGVGAIKGGIRGTGVYILTNTGVTNAAVASAMFTAMFGVAEQVYLYHNKKLDENQLIENAETVCMDAAVSAVASMIGQAVIPVPILGAIIGNAIGMIMYQSGKDALTRQDCKLLCRYAENLKVYQNEKLAEYDDLLKQLEDNLGTYLMLLNEAYSPDINLALEGAVRMARFLGVSEEQILDSDTKFDAFFYD